MHNFTEIDQYMLLTVLLATASGAIGGIFTQLLKDIFSKIENQPVKSITSRVKSYAYASFMFSIPMGGLAFSAVIFNTSTPVKDVKQYIVPFAIIGLPLIALATKILTTFVFEKQDN